MNKLIGSIVLGAALLFSGVSVAAMDSKSLIRDIQSSLTPSEFRALMNGDSSNLTIAQMKSIGARVERASRPYCASGNADGCTMQTAGRQMANA